jgi:hypothetical protein
VGVPTGGTAGQVLAKIDGTNYNTEWVNQTGGGGGGTGGTSGTSGLSGVNGTNGTAGTSGLNGIGNPVSSGTAPPSGGSDGDIYLQYT